MKCTEKINIIGHFLWTKDIKDWHNNLEQFLLPKKPPCGYFSAAESKRNTEVSSDRVLIERYFGRMNSLWAIMANKYTWEERKYDSCVQLSVALTNYHVLLNPLIELVPYALTQWFRSCKNVSCCSVWYILNFVQKTGTKNIQVRVTLFNFVLRIHKKNNRNKIKILLNLNFLILTLTIYYFYYVSM